MQRCSAANRPNHLHARPFTVSALDVDDFVTLSYAEIDRLLDQFVQVAHGEQGSIADVEPAFHQIAQLEQPHAQTVAPGLRSIHKSAGRQVVENPVRCGGVQTCFLADLFE